MEPQSPLSPLHGQDRGPVLDFRRILCGPASNSKYLLSFKSTRLEDLGVCLSGLVQVCEHALPGNVVRVLRCLGRKGSETSLEGITLQRCHRNTCKEPDKPLLASHGLLLL